MRRDAAGPATWFATWFTVLATRVVTVRCLLALAVVSALPVGSASAGTYDVVSCHAPGADMRNLAWAFETFNATGRPAPRRPASS